MKLNSGIYQIRNLVNDDIYIGQSVNLTKRKYEHFRKLPLGIHENKRVQTAYNKYGKDNFVFEILIYCEPFELTRYEQFFVDNRHPEYNVWTECVTSALGTIRSEENKLKAQNTWKREGKFTMSRNINPTYWEEFKERYKNVVLVSRSKQEFPIVDIDNLRTFCYKNGELSDVLIMQLIKGKISKYREWKIITY